MKRRMSSGPANGSARSSCLTLAASGADLEPSPPLELQDVEQDRLSRAQAMQPVSVSRASRDARKAAFGGETMARMKAPAPLRFTSCLSCFPDELQLPEGRAPILAGSKQDPAMKILQFIERASPSAPPGYQRDDSGLPRRRSRAPTLTPSLLRRAGFSLGLIHAAATTCGLEGVRVEGCGDSQPGGQFVEQGGLHALLSTQVETAKNLILSNAGGSGYVRKRAQRKR